MGAPTLVRVKSDDRRAATLEIARAAFLQEGYAAASMSEIAVKVGGSKATLYNHFPSKKDLFIAVIDEEVGRSLVPLFDVSELSGDIRTVLDRFIQRFLALLLSDDVIAFFRLIVAESARFPEVGAFAYERGVKYGLDRLAGYFAEAMDRGEIRQTDAMSAAEQFLGLCAGHLHHKRLFGVLGAVGPQDIEDEARRIATTFLAAYGEDELSRAARGGEV